MASRLKIRQVRSAIGRDENQKRTVRALGLRRINQVVVVGDTPQVRGMVRTVRHLIEVEEVSD